MISDGERPVVADADDSTRAKSYRASQFYLPMFRNSMVEVQSLRYHPLHEI